MKENLRIFASDGGFVFSNVHSVRPQTPVENLFAMYASVCNFGAD